MTRSNILSLSRQLTFALTGNFVVRLSLRERIEVRVLVL
jgi:hypothetical protein